MRGEGIREEEVRGKGMRGKRNEEEMKGEGMREGRNEGGMREGGAHLDMYAKGSLNSSTVGRYVGHSGICSSACSTRLNSFLLFLSGDKEQKTRRVAIGSVDRVKGAVTGSGTTW